MGEGQSSLEGLGGLMYDFYKDKTVLVTGHTGFKGTWLCEFLTLHGAKVTGYALVPPTKPNLYELAGTDERINSIIGDIRDLDHLKKIFAEVQPEIVFHLAAQPIVKESYINPVYTYETNVMGTVNILECIRTTGSVRSFVNVTTDKVYDNKELDIAYKEEDYLDGFDPYSNSKSCSELVTHSYKRSFFNDGRVAISTARAGNVIGGGDFAPDRIIPDCIRAVATNKDIVVRNPYSIRPFQHVLESVNAYMRLAQAQYSDIRYSGAYNIGPDEEDCINTGNLVDIFCNKWGNIKWVNKMVDGPHEAGFLKLDSSKFKKTFNWEPRWHIEEAIEKTVEWTHVYLNNGNIQEIMIRQIKEFLKQ